MDFKARFKKDCAKVDKQPQPQRFPADMYTRGIPHDITDINNVEEVTNLWFYRVGAPPELYTGANLPGVASCLIVSSGLAGKQGLTSAQERCQMVWVGK